MADNKFEKILEHVGESGAIEYGIIRGIGATVFIKTGVGADIRNDKSKYVILAERLNKKYGCSVICASNPQQIKNQAEIDESAIDTLVRDYGLDYPEFFFGNSNGGIRGLELAVSGGRFTRMVIVNMPLMINMFKTKAMIRELSEVDIMAFYGDGDPSLPYVPFFKDKFDNMRLTVCPGADHNFLGMIGDFIGLADSLFIDTKEN